MKTPVKISRNGFFFAGIVQAVIVWASLIFRMKSLLFILFVILALSAVLSIKNNPLILVYKVTLEKIRFIKDKEIIIDDSAMKFAQAMRAVICMICAIFVYYDGLTAWGFVMVFAVVKTISACGYCPGEKIYNLINRQDNDN